MPLYWGMGYINFRLKGQNTVKWSYQNQLRSIIATGME